MSIDLPDDRKLCDVLVGPAQSIADRNSAFVRQALVTHQAFFDSVESRPLTQEQREAAVVMEDRNLLIAAAGSDKSSTVVAKIGYALRTGLCAPHEVLAVVSTARPGRNWILAWPSASPARARQSPRAPSISSASDPCER